MATMTAAQMRTLVGVTPGGAITEDHIVGDTFWYSIEEASVPLAKVRKAFRDNGLDEDRLPKARRPEHVAQEACRSVERVTTNGHREEVRAEQVMRDRDDGTLIYQITKHVQDKAQRVIEHPKALRVIFAFESGELDFEPLGGATRDELRELEDEIRDYFAKNQTQMPGHKLRTIVRHYIEEAGAENLRGHSGGIYFLAKQNPLPTWSKLYAHHGDSINGRTFIQQVRMMLEDIYGAAPNFHDIPMINDEGQREFLKRKIVENCADDAKEFRDECIELVKEKSKRERGYRTDKVTRMVQRRKELDMRRQKFEAILGEQIDELERDMTLADGALQKFLREAGQ